MVSATVSISSGPTQQRNRLWGPVNRHLTDWTQRRLNVGPQLKRVHALSAEMISSRKSCRVRMVTRLPDPVQRIQDLGGVVTGSMPGARPDAMSRTQKSEDILRWQPVTASALLRSGLRSDRVS